MTNRMTPKRVIVLLIAALVLIFAALLFVPKTGDGRSSWGSIGVESAEAHRPDLKTAQIVGKRAASYTCYNVFFPIDPYEQRCRTYGIELDGGAGRDRELCDGHGHKNGAWCFPRAWNTNNNFRVLRFRVRVTYKCATGPGGIPCVELASFYGKPTVYNPGVGG